MTEEKMLKKSAEKNHPKRLKIQQKWLIIMDLCPACEIAKEILQADIASGQIRIITPRDKKAVEILMTLGISEVPALIHEFTDHTYKKKW